MTATTVSPPLLLFTDLDGTLLDHHSYSWVAAQPALDLIRQCGIPMIYATSKTLAECLTLQGEMGVQGPVIFENGAGVALPKDKFPHQHHLEDAHDCWVKAFAMSYGKVRAVLAELRRESAFEFSGFGDMTVEDVAECTGLGPAAAANARLRRHGEPLIWRDTEARLEDFQRSLQRQGLKLTRGGRFLHVQGPSDKGQAMAWLARQYPGPSPRSVALGDSDNDRPMLERADIAVVVRSPVQSPPTVVREPPLTKCIVTNDPGPAGWNSAVQQLIREFVHG